MNRNDLLLEVVERYLEHVNYKSNDPFIQDIAKEMSEIEINEMWMLTQS